VLHVFDPSVKSHDASSQTENIDVICSISTGTLTVTLNNKVEDITQRLGSVELLEVEDPEDVDVFEWTVQAIGERDELQKTIATSQARVREKDEEIAALRKQLDELVEAKAEHEKQMLSKFALLLNEKKLKIRNMQRVLATSNKDRDKIEELKAVMGSNSSGLPRRGKRAAEEDDEDQDEEEDDAFEPMEVDEDAKDDDAESTRQDQRTPEPSDDQVNDTDVDEQTAQQDRSSPAKDVGITTAATDVDDEETASEDEDDEL
jgi:hypothetical protein